MSWPPYLILALMLSISGCSSKSQVEDNQSPLPFTNDRELPDSIHWFDTSSNGAAGNRMTLATSEGILAMDQPLEPWTIHTIYGAEFENRTTFLPDAEPWNLVAAMGPRGPVIAYRSPQYAMYVAEWDGSDWARGTLIPPPGEIYGFPTLAGSEEELMLSFPVLSSFLNEPRYSVLRLTNGILADLSISERLDFPTIPILSQGAMYLEHETLTFAFARNLSTVEVRTSLWQDLAKTPAIELQGPNPDGLPQSYYTEIAKKEDGGFVIAITAWEAFFLTETGLRDAIIYDLGEETATSIQTRDIVAVRTTPLGVAVVRTDAQATHHIQILGSGKDVDIAQSDCTRFSILPDAKTITLTTREGQWESQFGLLPDNIQTCSP